MAKKRILSVGLGFMGQNHSRNILKSKTMEIAGIVDVIAPNLALKKSAGNLALEPFPEDVLASVPYFSDLKKAIAEVKPDAVLIATPTMFHHEYGMIALEAGCNIFMEKPLCINLDHCDELVRVAAEKHLVFMTGLCVRFSPEFQFLKNAVEKKPYGKAQFVHFSRHSGVPVWGCWAEPEVARTSGGAMFDLAIHDTDCARALFGNPDELCMQPFLRERFGLQAIDSIWRYKDGTLVRVEADFLEPPSLPFHREFTAIFETASLVCDMSGMKLCDKDGVHEIKLEAIDPYAAELDAFAGYLEKGEMPMECSGADATASVRICHRYFNYK